MKEQVSLLDYTIRGLELFAGGVLAFISFVARSLWKDYKTMEEKVEKLESQHEVDKILLENIKQDTANKIENIESKFVQKVERLEEITEMRLTSIDKNIEKLTALVEKMNLK